MKTRKLRFILLLLLIVYPATLLSQIKSEKATIHINNIPEKKPEIEMTLVEPLIYESEPNVIIDESFNIAGEIDNLDADFSVLVNNRPANIIERNFFFLNNIPLDPGLNRLTVDITSDGRILKRYFYRIYHPAGTENLADRSIKAGKYYALIIGINDYPAMGENLDNAIRDARRLYNVLADRYTFEKENMRLLLNPKREDLYIAFDKLSSEVTEDDNLLIFYAGHGLWQEETGLGYWLPSDARRENRAAWFPNSSLVDYLKAIKSKHTLLISDACFAGSIFKTRVFDEVSEGIEELYRLPSRKAITSGTLSEVPDESVFIEYLVDRLENNTNKYLPSESLYSRIRVAVENNSPTVPRAGVIQGVGDEGGDFIFILKE